MKKKGPRDIPDFSRKPQAPPGKVAQPVNEGATPKPHDPIVKTTSQPPKGGRRGG